MVDDAWDDYEWQGNFGPPLHPSRAQTPGRAPLTLPDASLATAGTKVAHGGRVRADERLRGGSLTNARHRRRRWRSSFVEQRW
jgi:hypothetical protein